MHRLDVFFMYENVHEKFAYSTCPEIFTESG